MRAPCKYEMFQIENDAQARPVAMVVHHRTLHIYCTVYIYTVYYDTYCISSVAVVHHKRFCTGGQRRTGGPP